MFGALARIGSARTALISTVEPVVTVALAVGLLDESLRPIQVVGAVLILTSVLVLQWSSDTPASHSGDKQQIACPVDNHYQTVG